jgi:hypothetical protein
MQALWSWTAECPGWAYSTIIWFVIDFQANRLLDNATRFHYQRYWYENLSTDRPRSCSQIAPSRLKLKKKAIVQDSKPSNWSRPNTLLTSKKKNTMHLLVLCDHINLDSFNHAHGLSCINPNHPQKRGRKECLRSDFRLETIDSNVRVARRHFSVIIGEPN